MGHDPGKFKISMIKCWLRKGGWFRKHKQAAVLSFLLLALFLHFAGLSGKYLNKFVG
jgi:hypothetical protein